jgi:protein arginine kinase
MNLASLVRFGVDLEMFCEETRNTVDRMFIECQPGHIQHLAGKSIDTNERDAFRSEYLRKQFENVEKPLFIMEKSEKREDSSEADSSKGEKE